MQEITTKLKEEKKAEESEVQLQKRKVKDAESKLQALQKDMEKLKSNYREEQRLRKQYYNQLEDLKGSIRVYARTRPLSENEIAHNQKQVLVFGDGNAFETFLIVQMKCP